MSIKTARQSDIAKELGISQVAVSKALRGATDISEVIRDKIIKTAKKLGYNKNMIASSLAEGKTKIIGYLVPGSGGQFFNNLLTSIQRNLQTHGYQLLIKTSNLDSEMDDKDIEIFLNYHVDGILTFPKAAIPWGESIYNRVLTQKIPLVFLNQDVPLSGAVSVFTDNIGGAYSAVKHIINLGHKNIGIYTNDFPHDSTSRDRYQGYLNALKDNNIEFKSGLVFGNKQTCNKKNDLAEFITAHPEMTAIFCNEDHLAIEIYEIAKELSLRIPDELSIVGFGNDIRYNEHFKIPMTTVSQEGSQVGVKAVELMLKLINKEKVETRNIVGAQVISRESVFKINKR